MFENIYLKLKDIFNFMPKTGESVKREIHTIN